MKKLMIIVAVAVSAIALNAATCTWSLMSITDSPKNAAGAGMAAYLMDASTYSTFTANVAGLADGSVKADAFVSYVTGNYLYKGASAVVSGRTGTSINVTETTGNTYAVGDTVNAYMVIFDKSDPSGADYFAYTGTQSATVAGSGANINLSYLQFGSATASTGGWTAVPEPTSGLLMLLGMAGLALRRRRA